MHRKSRWHTRDHRTSILNIITAATILEVGTVAGGVAIIPYLQGNAGIVLSDIQRSVILPLLFISALSYFFVVAIVTTVFASTGRRQVAGLNISVFFLAIQVAASVAVPLQVFWSLIIGDYSEVPVLPNVNPECPNNQIGG